MAVYQQAGIDGPSLPAIFRHPTELDVIDHYLIKPYIDDEGHILYYFVIGNKLPRDNEFRDTISAEAWIADRVRRDKANARNRKRANSRADALRSIGMTKTRYGWE